MTKVTRFQRGRNPGTKVCLVCGKRTWVSKGEGTDLCQDCYDEAGMENAHSDGHHINDPKPDCPWCQEEKPS